jgi:hypothetical protein
MTFDDLKRHPMMTRLAAAIYDGDVALAQEVLDDVLLATCMDRGTAPTREAIIQGKRIARPERLPGIEGYSMIADVVRSQQLESDRHAARYKTKSRKGAAR